MRIWLDMANSPHPVLFRSLAPELERRGHDLLVTTRDHGQTMQLTLEVWPEAVGHPVKALARTRIGSLSDRQLKPGRWRDSPD